VHRANATLSRRRIGVIARGRSPVVAPGRKKLRLPSRRSDAMNRRILALAVALALPFAVQACPPAGQPWTDADVRAHLTASGYTNINDVKFSEGVWTADATSPDGSLVEIKLDADTGKIIPDEGTATITKEAVIAKLVAAGYTNVHDVEFEGGVWKAEGHDPAGRDVELKIDPDTGKVLGSEMDKIQN
jgi:roadblock/LC7 domain-containing protein